MLDAPRSHWLPLQPLPASSPSSSCSTPVPLSLELHDGAALPGCSCSIEALRDTFAPLYYHRTYAGEKPITTTITHASTRDLAALLKLHAETLPLQYDPAFFISLLLNANYTVLVAKSKDGSIVACATAFLNPYLHELELLTLCVDPKHVRNGIATALLRDLAIRALESSHTKALTAILRVQTTNIPAVSLYTSLGFSIQAIEPTYYKGALTGSIAAHKMAKKIMKD